MAINKGILLLMTHNSKSIHLLHVKMRSPNQGLGLIPASKNGVLEVIPESTYDVKRLIPENTGTYPRTAFYELWD